jgi:hypothetical protein
MMLNNAARSCRISTLVMLCLLLMQGTARSQPSAEIDFNRDIRPILSNTCWACHGPDDAQREGGLRLDLPSEAHQELESGNRAIVPGDLEQSALYQRISSADPDEQMPPADFGKPLSAADIAKLKAWVQQGGKYAQHWSYVKPVRPVKPEVDSTWPKSSLDNFVLRRILEHGLTQSPEADRHALVRRVYLDLLGLPPTIAEVDQFVGSDDPAAYEKLVDALLLRPEFGEHWARKWLDLARYADSAGYADDPARTIWGYRDWVIQAINNNMPFDQFTVEQLAGDLLPDPTPSQLIATAFHRNTMTNNEGGTQDEEFRNVAVVDRVNTTMAVWMGTTIACAQCHNHKYDPITQEEYFQFFAVWNSTQDADRRDESPRIELFTDAQKLQKKELAARLEVLKELFGKSTPVLEAAQGAWEQRLQQPAAWMTRRPASVTRKSGLELTVEEDGSVLATAVAKQDTYTVDLRIDGAPGAAQTVAALRLQSLPNDALPAKGSGLAGGNFVVTGVTAQLVPDGDASPMARFVRVTNDGKGQILSLAEVEIMSGGVNVARGGKATQQSTAFAGPAELAIDGNTDGIHANKSVTHTETVDDPWWEVDLTTLHGVDSIAIWNRTDSDLHTRLNNFTIALLDEAREVVWQQKIVESPNPSATYSPSNIREVSFRTAFSDYEQPKFAARDVLTGKTGADDGWAVGGQADKEHQLVLVPATKLVIDQPTTLRIHIQQNSPSENHLLGYFRLSTTEDNVAIERSRLPGFALATLDKSSADRSPEESQELAKYYRAEIAPTLAADRKELAKATKTLAEMKPATSVPVLREMDTPRETRLQFRGSYLEKGDVVQVGVPAIFHEVPSETPLDRLALARWLVSSENPLTARVVANRYWESFFGQGIVLTSEEFGSQGELPTHPQLLDWLAVDLIESGWDTKALVRSIVTSATYRQSAKVNIDSLNKDADNQWMSRGPRVRLSAEMVRDQALFAAGLLSDKMFGEPVKPPQPSLGLTAAFGSSTDWKTSAGADRYRRAIYTLWRRSNPYPSMATFDAPNREVCTVRRNRTNTPLQSLVTLNDPVYVEAAQSLARKALEHDGGLNDKIDFAFRRCVSRPPTEAEIATLAGLYQDARAQLADDETKAMNLATKPLGPLPDGMVALDAAAMTVVGNVILNLDEMFLKR